MVKVVQPQVKPRMDQAYQSLPCRQTKPKPPGHREVETPTKHYQDLCSRCETHWQIRFGLPTLTRIRIWLHHHSNTLLPTLTSRGVKYTHDINRTVLHSDRGPLGLCVISQSRHQSLEVGGDPPTPRHNVATPHAVATLIHGGVDPTTRSFWAYDVYSVVKANYFGKEFLRMAGNACHP